MQLGHSGLKSCGIVLYMLAETIVILWGVVMDGSNIPHLRYCGPWHFTANSFLGGLRETNSTIVLTCLSVRLSTLHGCHFVWTKSQKLFAIYLR